MGDTTDGTEGPNHRGPDHRDGARTGRRERAASGRATSDRHGPGSAGRTAKPRRRKLLPEDYLQRAMRAKSSKSRANWATKGLEHGDALDPTTQAMLLRQLYLAHFSEGHFERAHELALQALEFDVLPDVLHQDAARAKQGLGDVDGAIEHLRLAARKGPPHRRAFHAWTLGSMLLVAGRHEEAIASLQRAARWGTRDKPLYRGHLALAKCRAGQSVSNVRRLIDNLARCPAGNGYGRFILGQLAFEAGDHRAARDYLEAFVHRTEQGQEAMTVALSGELEMARQTLAKLG